MQTCEMGRREYVVFLWKEEETRKCVMRGGLLEFRAMCTESLSLE